MILAEGPALVNSLPASHLDPSSLLVQLLVVYLLVGVFAFFGSQDLFQRIYAARGGEEARRGLLLFIGALVVMGITAVGLGIAARAVVPDTNAGTALVVLTDSVLPVGLVGIVLLGLLALANSDADSQLLTSTSNVTHDFVSALGVELSREAGMDRSDRSPRDQDKCAPDRCGGAESDGPVQCGRIVVRDAWIRRRRDVVLAADGRHGGVRWTHGRFRAPDCLRSHDWEPPSCDAWRIRPDSRDRWNRFGPRRHGSIGVFRATNLP